MADPKILSPQSYETAETLTDADVQEVYQPNSGGIRRNKQATLATLKEFFRKLTSFTPNSIVEADGTGNLRTTSISTSALSQSITDTNTNTNEITDKLNQGVKTVDNPTWAGATIAGHDVDAELSTLNNRVGQSLNPTDSPTFADATIGGHAIDSELDTLNSRVNQGVNNNSTPNFEDITLTGLSGSVEANIETNTTNISNNDTDILAFTK